MNKQAKNTMRRAAEVGRGALDGIKDVHGKAQVVSRVPRIGKALGLVVYAAGAIRGAASSLSNR
jgi:hypothetical protein